MHRNRFYLVCGLILLVSAVSRLANLEVNPAWYTDEGTHIEIARHLMNGEIRYLALKDSFLIAARLPLFEYLLAFCFQHFGVDIVILRLVTSWLGILTTALIYRVVWTATHNHRISVFTMAVFAVYPQAVIYSRFGFSYNLLPVLFLLGLWLFLRYQLEYRIRYLVGGCLVFGLATISDFAAFAFLPPLILWLIYTRPKQVLLAIPLLTLPFVIYVCREIGIHSDIVLFDLCYTLMRAGNLPVDTQIANVQKNIHTLLTTDIWIPVGLIGICFIHPRQFRVLVGFMMILPVLSIGRTVALYNLSAYYLIPSLPFVVIGVASLVDATVVKSSSMISNLNSSRLFKVVQCIIFLALVVNLSQDIPHRFEIGIENFLVESSEGRQIQDYFTDYARPNDVVIVSPTLAWMVDASVTDYQLAILSQGLDAVHFPSALFPQRFAFDADYHHATFAVVDSLWRDWGAVHMPAVADMLQHIQSWNVVYETATIQIYRNPET